LINNIKLSKIKVHHELSKSSIILKEIKEAKKIFLVSFILISFLILLNFFDNKSIKSAYAATATCIDAGFSDIKEWQDYRIKLKFITEYTKDPELSKLIIKYSRTYKIEETLLLSLIKTESSLDPMAENYNLNGTIDRGLCQLNSRTFSNLDKDVFFNPETNIKYGAELLSWCLKRADNNIVKALAFYNAGIGNVANKNVGEFTLDYINNIIKKKSELDKEYIFYINRIPKVFY
jgi:soluble lytic murein transglycosylase-like protein